VVAISWAVSRTAQLRVRVVLRQTAPLRSTPPTERVVAGTTPAITRREVVGTLLKLGEPLVC
jgi:hypothetical protein